MQTSKTKEEKAEMNQRQGIRGEKGITLLTLVITVALMVILTAAMVNNSSTSFHLSKLTKLQNDIEMLNDRVEFYYVREGKLPLYKDDSPEYVLKKSRLSQEIEGLAASDGEDYYIINIGLLKEEANMSDLNYGNKWNSTSSAETDKYIINGKTHIVYYVQGINFEGEMYHTVGKNIQKGNYFSIVNIFKMEASYGLHEDFRK